MAQNLSNFAEALKIDYLPVIREQLNNSSAFLSTVQRNEKDVSGSRWQLTAHYQRNTGVGAGSETDLPTAGNQAYKNPYGVVKYNRGRIQVSGPVIEASRDDKGAIVRALDAEIQGVTRDLKKEINYQLMNDGTSVRCLVNGDPSTGTTLTVDTPGTNYLYDGIIVDVVDATTGAVEDADVILSTVNSTTACTASAALDAGIEDNSKVVKANSTDGAGTSYEMVGIKGIVDDGTYLVTLHGLSRDSYAWWKCSTSTTDSNAGTNRDLDLDLIQAQVTAVEKNGGKVGMIISDHDIRDAYAALVVADKRFVNTLTLDGGFKALEYNGIPWVAEVDCQPNTVFFLDMEHLFLMQMGDWKWMDRDGAVLSRVSGSDAYEAAIVWYADLATDRPKAHAFLRDVQ
jgi:hypothetical protein